jgi:hypothetical protein
MTREQIEAKIAAAKAEREQFIGQINACNGYIQAYEEMLKTLITEPSAYEKQVSEEFKTSSAQG